MKKVSFKTLIQLFISFFKVGALTFGGGMAMLSVIEREAVEKRKWIKSEEILDIVAIAESTPGPIAVNSSTYIGYKVGGFLGALFATLGLVLPPFFIIYIISLFYETFMKFEPVVAVFKGLSIGVIVMITIAFTKLKKNMKLNITTSIIFVLVIAYMVLSYFLNFSIPFFTIILVLFGFTFGVVCEALKGRKKK